MAVNKVVKGVFRQFGVDMLPDNLLIKNFELGVEENRQLCDFLKSPDKDWINVELQGVTFENSRLFYDFLMCVVPTVQSLSMTEVYITRCQCNSNPLSIYFPELTVLRVIKMRCHCTCLSNQEEEEGSKKFWLNILGFDKLKYLEISGRNFNKFFDQVSCGFQLTTYVAHNMFKEPRSIKKHQENFASFLRCQQNLEILAVDNWMGLEALDMIFKLPKLQTLLIRRLNKIEQETDLSTFEFPQNPTIMSMDLRDIDLQPSIIKALIMATPNLVKLRMRTLDQEIMEFLSENAKKLKSLKTRFFHVTNLASHDLFPVLEEFRTEEILPDIVMQVFKMPIELHNRLTVQLMMTHWSMFTNRTEPHASISDI